MKYRVLPEPLVVLRLAAHDRIPPWALDGGFFSVVRTRDELSIVCQEDACQEDVCVEDACKASQLPDGAAIEHGWIVLQLEGPFPFSMTGVLASFVQPLAAAQVPIFAISTFDTDYVLIKHEDLERAVMALAAAGHERVA